MRVWSGLTVRGLYVGVLFVLLSGAAFGADPKVEDDQLLPPSGEGEGFGRGLDVLGSSLIVSAPEEGKLYFFSRNASGEWAGPTAVEVAAHVELSQAVAWGSDDWIYYVVLVDEGTSEWQVRRRKVWGLDSLVFSRSGNPMPTVLKLEGDLMVVGSPGGLRAFERSDGVWAEIFISGGFTGDTDGQRLVIAFPDAGTHGEVKVYEKGVGPLFWTDVETIVYSNPFQVDAVEFGSAVALDGDCLAVGMRKFNAGSQFDPGSVIVDSGGVQIYHRSTGGTWASIETLVPEVAEEGDEMGTALDLLGQSLIVAGIHAESAYLRVGSATTYLRDGGDCSSADWSEQHSRLDTLYLGLGMIDTEGYASSVALSTEVGAVVGHPWGSAGWAWVYDDVVPLFAGGFERGDLTGWN